MMCLNNIVNSIQGENRTHFQALAELKKNVKLLRQHLNDDSSDATFFSAEGERIGDYYKQGLYDVFYSLAKDVYSDKFKSLDSSMRFELVVKEFNKRFDACAERYVFPPDEVWTINSNLFDGLFLNDTETNEGANIVRGFIEAYNNLRITNKTAEEKYFRCFDVEKYLDAYLVLCRFVFEDKCLYQEELRSLQIIEKILNVDYNGEKGCFGIYSPYVIFAILRTLRYISILPDEIDHTCLSVDCADYLNTRRHIVSTNAIRSFSRFTIINDKSYVVEYSRRTDCIVCKDAEKVSSVDNVKPIRLLEKITSYIYNYFEDSNSSDTKTFKISIYGFCAYRDKEGNLNPAEIDDLVYEIFSWFEDKRLDERKENALSNKKIDNICIDYYLINNDVAGESKESFVYEYFENVTDISHKCYVNIFGHRFGEYNNKQISDCINKSDVVFILDCPWLATEDFNVVNEGDLDSYAKWVNQVSYRKDIDNSLQKQVFFNRTHLFASINDQFNRLAVDNAAKYGKVVRVVKDYLLKWLQQQIEFYKKNDIYKTIYVYNSSMRGMALSYYADYPIIREESYSNKRFSIMRFSTRDNKCVSVSEEKKIYVSLWNLVKYVDISFAYIGIKEYFAEKLYKFIDINSEDRKSIIKRDIISIMRNIVFVINYSDVENDNLNLVNIQIAFSKPIRDVFSNSNCSKNNFQEIEDIVVFFEKIITDIIFANSNGLGDDSIRDAFERCLYNQAKTVEDLFFLHRYSERRKNGSLSKLNIQVDTNETNGSNDKVDSLVPNFDSFGDKRAYNKLFDYLDMPRFPEYAVNSILNQTNKIFNVDKTKPHSIEILRNMMGVCEISNYTESFLYCNLKELLQK